MTPTIYVCGKTNVGKTTLIHTCLDKENCMAINQNGVEIYESSVINFAEANLCDPPWFPTEQEAQAIWYCVDGSSSGFGISQETLEGIKALGNRALIIVTCSELLNEEQIKSVNESLLKHFLREQIVLISSVEKTGLTTLLRKTKNTIKTMFQRIPGFISYKFDEEWDSFFANRLRLWNQKNDAEADSLITWAAGRAAAIAIIPLPLADVTPLVANEIYMFYKLARVYGIANDQSLITMILGCTGGSLVGKLGASLLPFLKIPIAAAVTYGVGKAAKAFFESGMEMNGDTIKEIFEKAQNEASNLFG